MERFYFFPRNLPIVKNKDSPRILPDAMPFAICDFEKGSIFLQEFSQLWNPTRQRPCFQNNAPVGRHHDHTMAPFAAGVKNKDLPFTPYLLAFSYRNKSIFPIPFVPPCLSSQNLPAEMILQPFFQARNLFHLFYRSGIFQSETIDQGVIQKDSRLHP